MKNRQRVKGGGMAPPLPSRPDGYFETTVTIAGFSEVIE